MHSRLIGSVIKKIKHPFEKRGYVRELIYARPSGKNTHLHQVVTSPKANVGRIEIFQGERVVGTLMFRFGKDIRSRPKEIRPKDVYVDIGNVYDALVISPTHRGGKLASQLLTELIHYTKKSTGGNIYLRVQLTNEKAVNLYRSFGFQPLRMVNGEQLMVLRNSTTN